MACAMVTGIAARVISKNPATLLMNPDISRHQAFTKLLSSKYVDLGFPLTHQGFGRPA
jgi:hypothetical protein